jgi:hypothetical protein
VIAMQCRIVPPDVVRVVEITGAKALDPLLVFLVDVGPSRGRVVVECYGSAWGASFSNTGGKTIAEFVATAPEGYLADKLERRDDAVDYLARIATAVQEGLRALISEGRLP